MKKIFFYGMVLFFVVVNAAAQTTSVYELRNLQQQDTLLIGWKVQPGDDPQWASPYYDDSKWQLTDPGQDITQFAALKKSGICWIRLHIKTDNSLSKHELVAWVFQYCASEIFLDGELIRSYGHLNQNSSETEAYCPDGDLFDLPLKQGKEQIISVRMAYQSGLPYCSPFFTPLSVFSMYMNDYRNARTNSQQNNNAIRKVLILCGAFSGMLFIISLIYLFYFLFDRVQKVHLYYSISCAFFFLLNLANTFFLNNIDSVSAQMWTAYLYAMSFVTSSLFMLLTVYTLFGYQKRVFFKLLLLIGVAMLTYTLFNDITGYILTTNGYFSLCTLEGVRVGMWAMKSKKKGAIIILAGLITGIILNIWSAVLPQSNFSAIILALLSILGFPLGMAVYLAIQNAITNQQLRSTLTEVQELSVQNILQQQEKQQILSNQNELLEKQVTERTAALNQSFDDLKSTQKQLIQSEKMASLGELTAGIAHEIQNPLNFVNNFSEVNTELIDELTHELQSGNNEEALFIAKDIKDNEQKINHHGKRADAIVKGMLQHSRKDTGQKEPTDVNALADEYLRLSYQGLRAKDKTFNSTLKTDFDNAIGKINIIPQDIGRVLLNLYNNAFYAVNEKKKLQLERFEPTVSVSTKKMDNKITISVKDNGNGIPQKALDKIFQPFFTTKPTGQGTGLGLSLSYDIIKAHGGEIKVESKDGEGTKFLINLPV